MKSRSLGFILLIAIVVAGVVAIAFHSRSAAVVAEPDKAFQNRVLIGFSQMGAESAWRIAFTKSMREAASGANVELLVDDANQQQEFQLQAVKKFILQKVDLIVIAPIVQTGWREVLLQARAARIPVIVVDRSIDDKDLDLIASHISLDFYREGQRAADCLLSEMPLLAGKKYRLIELEGTRGSSAAILRGKAFRSRLLTRPDIEIIKSADGDFKEGLGKEIIDSFIRDSAQPHPQIDAIFAHNDSMALGAIAALDANGYSVGHEVKVSSVDGEVGALKAIVDRKLVCSAECTPLLGDLVIETAKKIVGGLPYSKKLAAKELVFDRKNAGEFLKQNRY